MRIEAVGTVAAASLVMLRRHRILGAASDADLGGLLSRSSRVTLGEREPLFAQGDAGRAVVFVLAGFIKLSSSTSTGREVVLEICGPGSLFGELAVLNGWPRSADAVALSGATVLSVPGPVFRDALVRSPDVMFGLVGVLSRRLQLATEQVRDAASLPGPARLAKALMQLAATYGRPVGGGLQVDVSLSQRELGGLTGLARESINKQMAAWRDAGWIEMSPKHVTLLASEALRDVAAGSPSEPK